MVISDELTLLQVSMHVSSMHFSSVRTASLICDQTHAGTITVTNTNDSGPVHYVRHCRRERWQPINFTVSGTIVSTSEVLVIDNDVTISGPGANRFSINGNRRATVRIFGFAHNNTVTIFRINHHNGHCGIFSDHATLTVNNSVVSQKLAAPQRVASVSITRAPAAPIKRGMPAMAGELTLFILLVSYGDGRQLCHQRRLRFRRANISGSRHDIDTTMSGNSAGEAAILTQVVASSPETSWL